VGNATGLVRCWSDGDPPALRCRLLVGLTVVSQIDAFSVKLMDKICAVFEKLIGLLQAVGDLEYKSDHALFDSPTYYPASWSRRDVGLGHTGG
jgi:hypothetical protein